MTDRATLAARIASLRELVRVTGGRDMQARRELAEAERELADKERSHA